MVLSAGSVSSYGVCCARWAELGHASTLSFCCWRLMGLRVRPSQIHVDRSTVERTRRRFVESGLTAALVDRLQTVRRPGLQAAAGQASGSTQFRHRIRDLGCG